MRSRISPLLFALFAGVFTSSARAQHDGPPASPETPNQDAFYWLGEINKASDVMVVEQGIVSKELGSRIASSLDQVMSDGRKPGAVRSSDYLDIEKAMIAYGGPDMTRIHSGRSRQDIGATFGRLFLREDVLDLIDQIDDARAVIIEMAAQHPDDVMPAYTWGVQAQPISFGHYMLGYAEALARASTRLEQSYARVNLSPLGSAALGTSSFPVNRPRLAELLGFDGVLENSFDANQLSEADTRAEVELATATGALSVGMLLADVTQQYAQIKPWLILDEGHETGVSSIMPQKRNPSGIVYLRVLTSNVIAGAEGYLQRAHNVPSGMMDYKLFTSDPVLTDAGRMYHQLAALLKSLRFDPARALDEVAGDYSTTTELADTLQRVANVPFRVGHHFASELTTFGRSRGMRPSDIPFVEAQRIYAESAKQFGQNNATLPLSEQQFRTSLSPQGMVRASQGLGGPQPAEVARMLQEQRALLEIDRNWVQAAHLRIAKSTSNRQQAFEALGK